MSTELVKLKCTLTLLLLEEEITLEIPEELNGADLSIYNIQGKVVHSEKILGSNITVDLNGMKSGHYILDFVKGDTSIKKKLAVN